MSRTAYDEKNNHYMELSNDVISSMNSMIYDFVLHYELSINPKTMYGYLTDIAGFFRFIVSKNPLVTDINQIDAAFLNKLSRRDYSEYLHHLRFKLHDTDRTISRKLSALNKLLKFLLNTDDDFTNADFQTIERPKLKKKKAADLIYLDHEEISTVINNVEHGTTLTKHQKAFHERTKVRDVAIVCLMTGTGIRISECVNLDIEDVNLHENSIMVVRKRGNSDKVFFSDKLAGILSDYLDYRNKIEGVQKDSEHALFLSSQKRRISDDAVRNLVKKYAPAGIVNNKKITPHKLRSSYGMAIYDATDDIYAVQEVLGHESAQTSEIYVKVKSERKKQIGKIDVF